MTRLKWKRDGCGSNGRYYHERFVSLKFPSLVRITYWSQTNPKRHSYYFNCVRYTKLRDALIAAEGVTL